MNINRELFRKNYETALYWTDRGFKVFPTEGKGSNYKVPITGCKWGEEATSDKRMIDHWWYNCNGYGVALSLKHNHYIVIDCDVKNNIDGVTSFKALLELNEINSDKIFQSRTPSGGRHYYFKLPNGVDSLSSSSGDLPKGIEVKGTNSCIMARGTVSMEGLSYDNDLNSSLDIVDTLEVPQCIMNMISSKTIYEDYDIPRTSDIPVSYARKVLDDEIEIIRSSIEGTRNNNLNRSAFLIGTLIPSGSLDREEVEGLLLNAALEIGLDENEAENTIYNALDRGEEQPRTIPDLQTIDEFDDHKSMDQYFDIGTDELDIDSPLFMIIWRYAYKNAYINHPELALGSTISLLSILMAREVFTPTRMNVSIYALLIAETGAGKDDYLNFPQRILDIMKLNHLIGETNFSSAVHIEKIFEDQLISLHTIDEFHTFLKKITSKRASHIEEEIGMLLKKIWSYKCDSIHKTKGSYTREAQEYLCPALAILGASTPRSFFSSVNLESFYDGLINRFTFFSVSNKTDVISRFNLISKESTIYQPIPDRVKRGISKLCKLQSNSEKKIDEIPCNPLIIPWENEDSSHTYFNFIEEISKCETSEREMFIRLADQALRIATIIAVSRDFAEAKITKSDMQNGIIIAKMSGNFLYYGKNNYVSENIVEKYSKKIASIIKDVGKKGITRSALTRKTRMITKRQRDESIADLLESNLITAITISSKRGPDTIIYKYNK